MGEPDASASTGMESGVSSVAVEATAAVVRRMDLPWSNGTARARSPTAPENPGSPAKKRQSRQDRGAGSTTSGGAAQTSSGISQQTPRRSPGSDGQLVLMTAPANFRDGDDDELEPRRGSKAVMKTVAGVAAVAVLGFGATTALSKSNSSSSKSATGTPAAQTTAGYGTPGRGPMGTQVTGNTLTKLKAAVAAKYPGTVEQAMKLRTVPTRCT